LLKLRLKFFVIELEELLEREHALKVEEEELAECLPILFIPKWPKEVVKRPQLVPVDVLLVGMW
jgi:hypothetical protein